MKDLSPFFYPGSIALIGASETLLKWGSYLFLNIVDGGFEGKIYPVSLTKKTIYGILVLLLVIPDFFVIDWLYNNLPYCVTHICGNTHNFGIADLIWTFYPVLSLVVILIVGFFLIYLDLYKGEVTKDGSVEA